jgi:putative SOS response-associated peptidase YedK
MCARLTQYRGIHDFVAALSTPNALANSVGDQPIERFNVAPSTQVALIHLQGDLLHADSVRWGWRPHWAKDGAEQWCCTRANLPRSLNGLRSIRP